jgi:two-component system LytT family response regulator
MNKKCIKTLLVDDDEVIRASFKKMLQHNFDEIEIVGEAANVADAVKCIHQTKPELVFLDIDMPGHSGIELPEFFAHDAIDFSIVFVTAFSHYAINAFELSAVDYILKPAGVEHVQRALKKLQPIRAENLNALKQNLTNTQPQKIALQTSGGLFFVELNDIVYLKADGSYTHVYFANGSKETISKKLTEFSALEKTKQFMRIHRSHTINLHHISKIEKGATPCVTMSDSTVLPIASERKQALFDFADDFRI